MSVEGYFTPNNGVLENKLGITNPDEMKKIESRIVAIRMSEVLASAPKGKMDFVYLKKIHRRLFSDIYPTAGKVRTVDIAKGDSVFCYAQYIDSEQRRVFKELESAIADDDMSKDVFVKILARLSADLNALHPFWEGNGRAIRTFLILFASRHHYHLDFGRVSTQRILDADIAAFHGDYELLIRLYHEMLTEKYY